MKLNFEKPLHSLVGHPVAPVCVITGIGAREGWCVAWCVGDICGTVFDMAGTECCLCNAWLSLGNNSRRQSFMNDGW